MPQPKLSEFRSRSSGACELRLPPPMRSTDLEAPEKHHLEVKDGREETGGRVTHPLSSRGNFGLISLAAQGGRDGRNARQVQRRRAGSRSHGPNKYIPPPVRSLRPSRCRVECRASAGCCETSVQVRPRNSCTAARTQWRLECSGGARLEKLVIRTSCASFWFSWRNLHSSHSENL